MMVEVLRRVSVRKIDYLLLQSLTEGKVAHGPLVRPGEPQGGVRTRGLRPAETVDDRRFSHVHREQGRRAAATLRPSSSPPGHRGGIAKRELTRNQPAWADPSVTGAAAGLDDDEVAAFCRQFPQRLIGFGSIHRHGYQPQTQGGAGREGTRDSAASNSYPHSGSIPQRPSLELGCLSPLRGAGRAGGDSYGHQGGPLAVDEVQSPRSTGTTWPRGLPDLKVVMCHAGSPGRTSSWHRGPLHPRLGGHSVSWTTWTGPSAGRG